MMDDSKRRARAMWDPIAKCHDDFPKVKEIVMRKCSTYFVSRFLNPNAKDKLTLHRLVELLSYNSQLLAYAVDIFSNNN